MHSLDQLAQDWVEGRAQEESWIYSLKYAEEQVRISILQYSTLEKVRTFQGYVA